MVVVEKPTEALFLFCFLSMKHFYFMKFNILSYISKAIFLLRLIQKVNVWCPRI